MTMPSEFAARLLAGMSDAVVHADAQGRIVVWAGGAERIFGFSAAEAVGQSLDVIIPEGLRGRHWEGYRSTMATGESRYGAGDLLSVPALRKDGGRISVEFTIVPFKDADGRMEGVCAVMRDVTARFEEVRALKREVAGLRGAAAPRGPT